ncbi:sensor histidine kinase [Actinocatenispora thailandica]|uniref:sensor histidine kinase n=1 Tax=Actinocatenispora thailandica TaxID=227318 RepID=UPI0031DD2F53
MKKQSQDTGTTSRIKDSKPPASIKARFIRVVLIPSIALVIMWAIMAGYFVFNGLYTRELAKSVQDVSLPALTGLSSLQKERSLSMAQIAKPGNSQALRAQRQQTDSGVEQMQQTAADVLGAAPADIKSKLNTLNADLDQLPDIRRKIDARTASAADTFSFYNKVLDAAAALFDAQARFSTETDTLQGAVAGTQLFHIADLQSRAGSIITGAFASGRFTADDLQQFHTLVGAYHDELQTVTPLRADVQQQYDKLVRGSDWATLTAAEQQLVAHGAWSGHVPNGLGIDAQQWQQASTNISDTLLAMTTRQGSEVAAAYLDSGNNNLLLAGGGSLVALLVVVAAVWLAIRRSRLLVDGTVKVGLDAIAAESKAIAAALPEALDRIGRGEQVEVQSLMPADDENAVNGQAVGAVEIKTVQDAVRQTSLSAMEAASAEAIARKNSRQNLVLAARRSQRWLSTLAVGLRDLERAEQDDPDKLEKVYALQHKITTLRGDNDNLIILGGGDIGRTRRTSEWIDDVLGAAKAQCEQFRRVRVEAGPKVKVSASAVLPISHLLAQLLNNAVAFSHPPTQVLMTSSPVAAGLVVEIEDRGIGMSTEERERANALIREAPELVSSANVQKLGFLVVASVAQRFNIRVELKDSAYGGVKAIVLIPNDLLDRAGSDNTGDLGAGRRALPEPPAEPAPVGPAPTSWAETRTEQAPWEDRPGWGDSGSRTEAAPVGPAPTSWADTRTEPVQREDRPTPGWGETAPRAEPSWPEPAARREPPSPHPVSPAPRPEPVRRPEPVLPARAESNELSDNTIQFPAIDPFGDARGSGTREHAPAPTPRRPEPGGAEPERPDMGGHGVDAADVSLPQRRSTVPGRSGAEHGAHRASGAEESAPPRPRPYPTPRERQDEPEVPVLGDAGPAPAPNGNGQSTSAGLPIRVRQASLAPGLRRPRVESNEPTQAVPTHTADQARLRFAAFQQGMTAGRQANENSTDTVTENRNSDG